MTFRSRLLLLGFLAATAVPVSTGAQTSEGSEASRDTTTAAQ